ncbi:MAG: BRO-N domain-containing protein [Sarcina sp.]
MKDILIENFEEEIVYTFILNGRPCWIGNLIAKMLDYSNTSKVMVQCIESEGFEKGVEYEELIGEDLKNFKEIACEAIPTLKYASKLFLFYEVGLYGFLQYSDKPIAIKFKKWIRREVIPQIKKTGQYIQKEVYNNENKGINKANNQISKGISDNLKGELSIETKKLINKIRDNINNESGFDVDKFQRMRVTLEALKFFKPILDEITDNTLYKFEFLKDICTEAGIALPVYVEEDNIL